ncbi:flagellar filament capping protein FliD [Geodermatophilus sp. SYSU D00703]
MSVGGLISGMDTQTIVSQLMQIEANPQTLLKQRLSAAQAQGTAYRALNTRFEALRSAADDLMQSATWSPVKATASGASVTASTGTGATAGSLTFAVDELATAHSVISAQKWTVSDTQTAADAAFGSTSISVTVGGTTTSIPVTAGSGTPSLADAVKAINNSSLGLTATAVKVDGTNFQLQVTSKTTGAAKAFRIGADGEFPIVTQGLDAKITVGTGPGKYSVSSATNTFSGLLEGVTLTVSEKTTAVTVKVADDPAAIAADVSAMVGAANALLQAISDYTSAESASAALKGDSTLRQLADRVLDTVARTLGPDGSLSVAGVELTKDGRLEFDKSTFEAQVAADPTLVKRMFTQTTTAAGTDGVSGTSDDVTSAVGFAARLADLARVASDQTTGTLTLLANGKDSTAKDLQDRIDAWDIRLELREAALTRQFTAMETALSTLQNQSSWLSAQLASLPSWNTNSKS